MDVTGMSDALAVRNWINHDTSKPCSATELMAMWKACTTEEKSQFGKEARQLLAAV
jgi:hypothetical protein